LQPARAHGALTRDGPVGQDLRSPPASADGKLAPDLLLVPLGSGQRRIRFCIDAGPRVAALPGIAPGLAGESQQPTAEIPAGRALGSGRTGRPARIRRRRRRAGRDRRVREVRAPGLARVRQRRQPGPLGID
jgi:hypothetical protein